MSHRHRPVAATPIAAEDKDLAAEVETPASYTAPEKRPAGLPQSNAFAESAGIDPGRRIGAGDRVALIGKDEMAEAASGECPTERRFIGNPPGTTKVPRIDK
jgi:hypothetical protein